VTALEGNSIPGWLNKAGQKVSRQWSSMLDFSLFGIVLMKV